jgi:hypothetical protein
MIALSLLIAAVAWPAPVDNFVPPKPGEHPRLFFRQADVPALRKKALTPEGKVMVARLKMLLGGGEAMPTVFPQATAAYQNVDKDLPRGAFTLWHGAGFGMLYQLTGEKKYADLGRQCVEKALAGVRDRDDRYAFVNPGGFLRAGPSVGAIAMAYDLCYDGWEPAFREKLATTLQNYNGGHTGRDGGGQMTMERLALRPQMDPASNHWGPEVGGAALTLLAIRGDPGTDTALIDKYLAGVEKNTLRGMTEGFGDGGYFMQHAGPGGIMSATAFLTSLQAWRVAGGKDFITPRPNAPMITMIRVYELLKKTGGGYHYLCRHPSSYGTEAFEREGMSRAGQICEGFGAIRESDKPALLWTYKHVLGDDTFDTVSAYPHRAALALVNWPLGVKERNPVEVLPRALHDTLRGYVLFRNRWQDENDIVVTALLGARNDGLEPIMIWGLGKKLEFPVKFGKAKITHFDVEKDGSGSFSAAVVGGVCAVAVKFVGEGCIVAMTAPNLKPVTAGDRTWIVMTLQNGAMPAVSADGETVLAGKQRFVFDGQKIQSP